MMFWFTHFKYSTTVTLDKFRTSLEEYCKLTIPDNGSLRLELRLENFSNSYLVSYFKDQQFLTSIVPPFNKDPIDHPFLKRVIQEIP